MIGSEWEPHHLYRIHDHTGTLLYIGITWDLCTRMRAHTKAAWWPRLGTITLEQHPHYIAARKAEKNAIQAEGPIHNRDHNKQGQKGTVRDSTKNATVPEKVAETSGKTTQGTVRDSFSRVPDTSKNAHTRKGSYPNVVPIGPLPLPRHLGHCENCRAAEDHR